VRRVLAVAFWTFLALTSLINFVVAVVLWILSAPFDRDRRLNHLWSCWWASLYAYWYPGWNVRYVNREKIRPDQAYVLVANHTSIADIVLCFGLFRQFKWVSKRSVFKAPLIGWNMWLCRYVPLVRGEAISIARMMEHCRMWLRRGISIMMFPEGTRSLDGALRPFKHGAFTLALEAKCPVVPIAIHGGYALIPKTGNTFAAKADLTVEVLDPIPCDGFDDPSVYAEAVRHQLQIALAQKDFSERRGELDAVPGLETFPAPQPEQAQRDAENLAGR
jgi:1-acyl-sn-glycerol-3-phosphate acyltransferase